MYNGVHALINTSSLIIKKDYMASSSDWMIYKQIHLRQVKTNIGSKSIKNTGAALHTVEPGN